MKTDLYGWNLTLRKLAEIPFANISGMRSDRKEKGEWQRLISHLLADRLQADQGLPEL